MGFDKGIDFIFYKYLRLIINYSINIKIQKVHFETNNSFKVSLIYAKQNLVVKVLQV